MAIYQKQNYNRELADQTLNNILRVQEQLIYTDVYDIKNIIKDLQLNNYNADKLFKIEWSYLKMLDENEYKPLTIEKKIASDPNIFNEILCLAYKARNDIENKTNSNPNLAMNAYDLLNKITLVPGLKENEEIDENDLLNWLEEVKKLSIENDRLDVALIIVGEILFHAPKDKDGFWINKSVAKILDQEDYEQIRRGYNSEAYNSVGAVNIDREGTVWKELEEKWEKRADLTELEGYVRFANNLRKLSKQYKEQAEYEIKNYDFE